MARIAGIDLPKDKRIEIGLTYIYGIGRKSAQDILAPVIAAACPFAVSAARPTHAPARAPRRPLRTRRSKEGE